MVDDKEKSKPVLKDITEDGIIGDIKTPVEIFFLFLIVVGILTIIGSSLVGRCGNIDDVLNKNIRISDYVPGATAIISSSLVEVGNTFVRRGVCTIIKEVDFETGKAEVILLAKLPPTENYISGNYTPWKAVTNFFNSPIEAVLFFHTNPSSGEVDLKDISPIATKPLSNALRDLFINKSPIIIFILILLTSLFFFIGSKFSKRRGVWYNNHKLRATYISRLVQDREKMQELRFDWDSAKKLCESDLPSDWNKAFNILNNILFETLGLLHFEGDNIDKRLNMVTDKDLCTIEDLWKTYCLIKRLKDEKDTEVIITEEIVVKIKNTYKESFVWLGLLPYTT